MPFSYWRIARPRTTPVWNLRRQWAVCFALIKKCRAHNDAEYRFNRGQFGRLEVKGLASASKPRLWRCLCACGIETHIPTFQLTSGKTTSCGCFRTERLRTMKHSHNVRPGSAFRIVLRRYKGDAKQRGLVWAFTDDAFREITQRLCFYCGAMPGGVQISWSGERFVWNGIDRRDSTLGYLPDNCVACCTRCNRMKMALPESDFIEACLAVADWQGYRL